MRRFLSVVPALLLLAGCSSLNSDIKVAKAWDPDTDLSALKKYQWAASGGIVADSSGVWAMPGFDLDAELRHDINAELRKAGYTEVATGADLYIAMLLLADRSKMEAVKAEKGPAADPTILTEGGLLVEFVDAKSGRVLWRGGVSTFAKKVHTDAEIKERIGYAVNELFEKFPH